MSEVFVYDAPATWHRKHATTERISGSMPSYMGARCALEVENLMHVRNSDEVNVVISGLKAEDKIPVIRRFTRGKNQVMLGGPVATTFSVAQGHNVARSVFESNRVDDAKKIRDIAGGTLVYHPIIQLLFLIQVRLKIYQKGLM